MIKPLQRLLRWFFMGAENTFNLAFGEKLNPFYHLGTITFWQFWLLVASGLYLYIFADTGVHDAYDSIEAITHVQWWAGGILRSIHRYATDGMILTMALHLTRHFAYDRYRGFRWFSWVSGVVLIWLVYVSGINGFMLVWDKLAQFIVVAVAEWFDALPIFNGTLIRNFIYEGAVNSRLFTLIAFVHIGAPLIVGFIMWIHVQRVPRAHINPPRPVAIAITLMFLVLALVKPILSQGGEADLGVVPHDLEFDWFQLPALALIYRWGPLPVWMLLLFLSALMFLVPWLPPKRRGNRQAEMTLTFHPDNRSVQARFGETLLDAGLRQDMNLPFDCRNGGCGVCKCTVLNGEVDPGLYQPSALSPEERTQGKVLMCCATALTDAEIEYAAGDMRGVPVRSFNVRVVQMQLLGHDVMQLKLALPSGEALAFKAGQYINILLENGERRSFSFANPPHDAASIELHIRLVPDGRFTPRVFHGMKMGDELHVEGPLGDFVLRESGRPIVLVAGATGFAPVKSMIEDAFHRGIRRPLYLYWGVRQRRDLYMAALPEQWMREHDNFHFVPVLSEPGTDDWTGRRGLVHEAILQDFPSLQGHEIYACGSVKMVEAVFPHFKAQGAEDGMCFSDAFTFAASSMALQPPEEPR
ncbi:2Fe-2S iron-sulfur cluster-binding protein [Denitratisoma oestradiolicum]|uniref:Ferredoxin-NAD reductase n=1 Tax=Denitratisoma oestradiolicum TaxID=311182 RepID=A0A6S6YBW5_9PROT|nr:2Fe-2S iron-sulfur cluster-binding protein [Denitratisoma oestradiolicum]TWO80339.1 ferredoxin-NAD reductase [Denitratisoma oestradiolicum]CAB1370136.1 Ferredoxin-NAD reductase [Denitratisoma oestradiolicum]